VRDRVTDSETGRQLASGRYVLSGRLGGGGTADVYRAVDTLLDRAVAVKIFRPGSGLTDEQRFEREARLLAPLSHPGLVAVYDAGYEDDRAYLVMQLIEGVTLRRRLSRGRLSPAEVAELGARLASVLAYVHGRGIVHRDLKPSNVLLTGDGTIAVGTGIHLADFGISRLVDTAHLTATGLVVGTVAYMAPEQVKGVAVGPAADMYALGLVLLECLTGHTEYTGGNAEAAVARLSRSPRIPAELPEPLRWVLSSLTLDDPVDRLTAEQCAAMLRDGGTGFAEITTGFLAPGRSSAPVSADGTGRPSPKRRLAAVKSLDAAGAPPPDPGASVPGVPPPAGSQPDEASAPPAAGASSAPADGTPGSREETDSAGLAASVVTDTHGTRVASSSNPRGPEPETEFGRIPVPDAPRRQRGPWRGWKVLKRNWTWAIAGCLLLSAALLNVPYSDLDTNHLPFSIEASPDSPSVSPGSAKGTRQIRPQQAGGDDTSTATVDQPGGAAVQPGSSPQQPVAGPSGFISFGPRDPGRVDPPAGQPSPIGEPPPSPDASPEPEPDPEPKPTCSKKNPKACKSPKPPKTEDVLGG
jgi:serine/threonine protein kinase